MRVRSGCLVVLLSCAGCGGSTTEPTSFGVITSVRYERVYTPGPDNGQRMLLNVSLPAQKTIPFCTAVQQTATTFGCDNLRWEVDQGEDAVIWINDPVLNRAVATKLFVNGIAVTRVETLSNGNELGHLRWSKSRGFE
jgi:hypothetical protein